MRVRRTGTRRGAAAVELAALLPFILYLAVIATDWARLLYYTITLESCARAGALYQADPIARDVSPYASYTAATQAAAPKITLSSVTTGTTTVNSTACVWVQVTYNFKTLTNFPGVPHSQTLKRKVEMRTFPVTANSAP